MLLKGKKELLLIALKEKDISTITMLVNDQLSMKTSKSEEVYQFGKYDEKMLDTLFSIRMENDKLQASWEYTIKSLIISQLRYGSMENIDLLKWSLKQHKIDINISGTSNIAYALDDIMDKFFNIDITSEKIDSFHEYLVKEHSDLASLAFTKISKEDNLSFVFNSPHYKNIKSIFLGGKACSPIQAASAWCNIPTIPLPAQERLFIIAIKEGRFALIKYWHQLGLDFPTEAQCYAGLVSTTRNEESIYYVFEHCKNLTVANHVILRTLISDNYDNLKVYIEPLLNKYSIEQLSDGILMLDKKKNKTERTIFFKSLLSMNKLNRELKVNLSSKKEGIRQIKL